MYAELQCDSMQISNISFSIITGETKTYLWTIRENLVYLKALFLSRQVGIEE